MHIIVFLQDFLLKRRNATKKELSWKIVFFIEQFLRGNKNRRFVISLLNRKYSYFIRRKISSPYAPKGIIYSTEKWFANPLQKEMKGSWVRSIYPNHSLILKSPNSFSSSIHPSFESNNEIHCFPESFLYFFKNVRVVNEAGSIISFDNKVFSDFTIEYGKKINTYKVFHTYIKKPLYCKGNFATIASDSTNYFHWMFDVLPRLKLLENVIENLDYIIVPKNITKLHFEMLNFIGIPEEKILEIGNGTHLLCESLFVPTLPVRKRMMSEWVCNFLRETFIPCCASEPFRKIYISRRDAFFRNIVNEDELINHLHNLGFDIIEMSKISFQEQVRICFEAKIIVSPHGAGLTNTVFCQRAKIFELFSPSYVNTCFWFLANQVGNAYYYMVGEDVNDVSPPVWRDFKIDVDLFKQNLNELLEDT